MNNLNTELTERLLRYCSVDSQSDHSSTSTPSTDCQHGMLDLLVQELHDIGASEVTKTG
jgi:tripeptide aminopeptidase